MTSCILQGGLGNQLFQIAAAKSLAIDTNDEFAINHELCFTPNQGNESKKYKTTLFKHIIETSNISDDIYIEQQYAYSPIPQKKNITIKGYFQSEKYFKTNINKIINLFYPSNQNIQEIQNWKSTRNIKTNTVGVHIRRGDYLRLSHHHVVLNKQYYEQAFEYFKNHEFVITSDDKQWARETFGKQNIYISDFDDEEKDFWLLSSCQNNIIANSTFSWWAAYLNKNKEKIVCCPEKWFTKEANCDTKDLIPENWIKI